MSGKRTLSFVNKQPHLLLAVLGATNETDNLSVSEVHIVTKHEDIHELPDILLLLV